MGSASGKLVYGIRTETEPDFSDMQKFGLRDHYHGRGTSLVVAVHDPKQVVSLAFDAPAEVVPEKQEDWDQRIDGFIASTSIPFDAGPGWFLVVRED